ncbi:uncharacterized protein LOC105186262 isoform X3 [Harpegnathos saltator]|uniref:uncharacterized protein LOC105186262 isoform X3 n=1 Tax=Harpegnathos saltator TaxID=610380 RepID=UPI000DBEEA7B|nr:uncharacterized protein LOC105186262 isoform X3 [Harpegnathos saltator]
MQSVNNISEMAIEYLIWELPLLLERIRRLERRLERRQLRDAQDPFALPREEFINCFRLTPEVAMYVIDVIRADLWSERTTGLQPEIKLISE